MLDFDACLIKGVRSFFGVAVSAVAFLVTPPLLAQEGADCASDDDCDPGYLCDRPPSAGTSSGSAGEPIPDGAPEEEPADVPPDNGSAGAPSVVEPTGVCEWQGEPCETDDDCPDNYRCNAEDVSVACPAGQDCPVPEVSGFCEPGPIECSANSDCPEGSQCGDEAVCTFELVECVSNSDCDNGYECFDIASEVCTSDPCATPDSPRPDPASSTPGAAGAASAEDEPPPEGNAPGCASEPQCETVDEFSVCFPPAVGCETDEDCEGSWVCVDIPEGGPGGWADLTRGCMPEGIALAIAGAIETGGAGISDDDAPTGVTSSESKGEAADTDSNAASGDESSGDDGGCAVSSASGRSTGGLLLGLGLAWFAFRRRSSKASRGAPQRE